MMHPVRPPPSAPRAATSASCCTTSPRPDKPVARRSLVRVPSSRSCLRTNQKNNAMIQQSLTPGVRQIRVKRSRLTVLLRRWIRIR
ncbi:unnamed protein product [Protopolystoma xenopodis]|uniref:Uncharacterized protein n=1 Tax=Protopolystoma xenopodis TaxID=117903 RepID=A0A3S5FER9_9PLAT|nr:unnamed protein product [Protopolystoma xenopodis]